MVVIVVVAVVVVVVAVVVAEGSLAASAAAAAALVQQCSATLFSNAPFQAREDWHDYQFTYGTAPKHIICPCTVDTK